MRTFSSFVLFLFAWFILIVCHLILCLKSLLINLAPHSTPPHPPHTTPKINCTSPWVELLKTIRNDSAVLIRIKPTRTDVKAFIQFFIPKSVTVTPLRSRQGSLKMAGRKKRHIYPDNLWDINFGLSCVTFTKLCKIEDEGMWCAPPGSARIILRLLTSCPCDPPYNWQPCPWSRWCRRPEKNGKAVFYSSIIPTAGEIPYLWSTLNEIGLCSFPTPRNPLQKIRMSLIFLWSP